MHKHESHQWLDPSAEIRQLANETKNASQTATNAFAANLTPVADPQARLVGYATSFFNGGQFRSGRIVDGVAPANAYIVDFGDGKTPSVALPLSTTSANVLGATAINTYAPDTQVLVFIPSALAHPMIIGAIPDAANIGKECVSDVISLASRWNSDEGHKRYTQMLDNGKIACWSGWKPFDGTHASEWGATTTTGLRVTLDDFLVQMAVNEFCGVFGFYHDQLLRISGYNFQHWTAGHERDAYMDHAEYNDTQGYSPYPWEAVGMLKPNNEVIKEYTPDDYIPASGSPYYSNWENIYENLQPFHRTQKFYGYYGQGNRTVVCAPSDKPTWWAYKFDGLGKPNKPYETQITNNWTEKVKSGKSDAKGAAPDEPDQPENAPIGLAEDNTALDGRRFIASAKGITLAKRMLLPVPVRLRRPENGKGDTEENYKAAGKHGGGKEHTITGDVETTATDCPHIQRAAGILDLHAYLFNYVGLHPFHWHAKDYKTWEQSELQHAQYNMKVPQYSHLKSNMYLPQPDATKNPLNLDHRYRNQKFYETESFISLLEDGAVVIGDGYGAEIRMCAGSITISAPGDVWLKPGKNAQVWAGRDCIVRANGSVDLSTTEKSVRIKAEKNVMILAGNDSATSGSGGVLIESRGKTIEYDFEKAGDAVDFSGVVLRAPESNVVGMAHHIYMRSGGGGSKIKPGNITLDAGKGDQELVTKANKIFNYVGKNGEISNFFGIATADSFSPQVAHYFSKDTVLLSGFLYASKQIFSGAGLIADGPIFGNGALVADTDVSFPCTGDCEKEMKKAKEKLNDYIYTALPNAARDFHDVYLANLWYGEKRAGNNKTLNTAEFSFRTQTEYRIDEDFKLFEDRWQQYARIADREVDTWTEKPVVTGGGLDTWPFPGKAKLIDEPVFYAQDFNFVEFDGDGFRDKDRGSGSGDLAEAYKTPKFGDSKDPLTLNSNYTIIK
jgi:hypothetical protein